MERRRNLVWEEQKEHSSNTGRVRQSLVHRGTESTWDCGTGGEQRMGTASELGRSRAGKAGRGRMNLILSVIMESH